MNITKYRWGRNLIRLSGFAFFAACTFGCMMLSLKFPGRSVNTGMPDSGIFGWIASICIILAFVSLFLPKSTFDDSEG